MGIMGSIDRRGRRPQTRKASRAPGRFVEWPCADVAVSADVRCGVRVASHARATTDHGDLDSCVNDY
jgi:hypothetical protein